MPMPRKTADSEIVRMLTELRPCPPRDPEAAMHGRSRFLQEVELLRLPAPGQEDRGLAGWIDTHTRQKDRKLSSALTAIALLVAVIFGGAGLTAYASQDALPGEALYPVKLVIEEALLAFSLDQVHDAELQMTFAARRAEELVALAQGLQHEDLPMASTSLKDQILAVAETIEGLQEDHPEQAAALSRTLDETLAQHQARLAVLLDTAPEGAQVGVSLALATTGQARQVLAWLPESVEPGSGDDEAGPPHAVPVGPPVDVPAGRPKDVPLGPPDEQTPAGPPADRPVGPPEERPVGPPDDRPHDDDSNDGDAEPSDHDTDQVDDDDETDGDAGDDDGGAGPPEGRPIAQPDDRPGGPPEDPGPPHGRRVGPPDDPGPPHGRRVGPPDDPGPPHGRRVGPPEDPGPPQGRRVGPPEDPGPPHGRRVGPPEDAGPPQGRPVGPPGGAPPG